MFDAKKQSGGGGGGGREIQVMRNCLSNVLFQASPVKGREVVGGDMPLPLCSWSTQPASRHPPNP